MNADITSTYRLQVASSVGERDGLGLELLSREGTGEVIAEVFHDDLSGEMTFTSFDDNTIPLAVLEWFLEKARDAKLGG